MKPPAGKPRAALSWAAVIVVPEVADSWAAAVVKFI
jgi:hypothetical protein